MLVFKDLQVVLPSSAVIYGITLHIRWNELQRKAETLSLSQRFVSRRETSATSQCIGTNFVQDKSLGRAVSK